MAKYYEQGGKLVPVDKDGKPKEGTQFPVSATPNKSFVELIRDKVEAPAPVAPQFKVTCERCGLQFSSMELAEMHQCGGPPADVEAALDPVPIAPRVKEAAKKFMATRLCALETCNKALAGKRPNARYCSEKCKRRASYLRRK